MFATMIKAYEICPIREFKQMHFFFSFLEKSIIQVNWNPPLYNSSVQLCASNDSVGNQLAF